MKQYPWLDYSSFTDGVFCRACALFAPSTVGGQDPGQFVTLPFKTWTKMVAKACTHTTKEYHQNAMSTMREFITRYEDPSLSVAAILDSEVQGTIKATSR